MPYSRSPNTIHNVRTSAVVGMVLALTVGANAQSIRFLGVPNGGGPGNIGQTDPSCTVEGDTVTCPNGGVTVHLAIYAGGWDDGTGRLLGVIQADLEGDTLHNGSFQILPRGHVPSSNRKLGAYVVDSICSGGASEGIACGRPDSGPFGLGLPGVDEDECLSGGGDSCVHSPDYIFDPGFGGVAWGPSGNLENVYRSWIGYSAEGTEIIGIEDPGVLRYVGDLVLEVPPDAGGYWIIGFNDNPDLTFMISANSGAIGRSCVGGIPPDDQDDCLSLNSAVIRVNGDCNSNGVDDFQDISGDTSTDCNANGIPDDCEDCNGNGLADDCDIAGDASLDCNDNGIIDECDIDSDGSLDCDHNEAIDSCEVESGTTDDCNNNGIPDVCDPDCNINGVPDDCDIAAGTSEDCDNNGVIDSCDIAAGQTNDCNDNGVPDLCDDCNNNGVPDEGDVFSGNSLDCNDNCVPDECDDCNNNGTADVDDIAAATSLDCNANCVPDECDPDCNLNGIPDDCDIAAGTSTDSDGNGVPDECLYPPALPGPPHDVAKNRYLSLALRNGTGLVAMSVTLPDGREAWIGEPVWSTDRGTDGQWIADLQTSPAGDGSDQVRDWSQYIEPVTGENLIHVRGCAIFPDQAYEIRARAAALEPSDPALFFTSPRPSNGSWADTVGTFDAGTSTWNPPNGTVNFLDLAAVLDQYQQKERSPVSWNDLGGKSPNYLINSVDILAAVQGFQSRDYWDIVPGHSSIADCVIPAP